MKKVLSFVLVLALVLGSFSMAFATEVQSDVVGKNCENAVKALQDLGVINGYNDGTFKPENTVTRAEAAKMVIAALGLTAQAEGNTTTFADCQGHWAAGYIGYAQALGVLKGRTATTFDPNGNVSYQELITMLVRAIGYTDASLPGTWPANYVTKAKGLGLLKDVEKAGNAAAVRGDVAIMIYNTVDTPLGYINNDNQWVEYATKQDNGSYVYETMLTRLEGQEKWEGVLTNGDLDTCADGVNLRAYLGAQVVPYFNADDEMIGIKKCKSEFLTGKYTSDGKFKVDDVKYAFSTKATTAAIAYFVNGGDETAISYGAMTVDKTYTIAVKKSEKTIQEIYSIAKWNGTDKEVTSTIVKNINSNDKIDANAKFVLNNARTIDTTQFELVGVKSLADIKKDQIITYYADTDKQIRKIEVTDAVVTGKVTKKSTDNTEITVNGTKYEMADGSAFSAVAKAGNEVKLTLTYAGDVFKYEKVSGELNNYAIVQDIVWGDDRDLAGDTPQIRLFLADGTKKNFNMDMDTLVDDGYATTAAAVGGYTTYAAATSLSGLVKGSLVAYDLDSNGDIVALEHQNATYSGNKVLERANYEVADNGKIGGYSITKETVVFEGNTVVTGAAATVTGDLEKGDAASIPGSKLTKAFMIVDEETDEILVMLVQNDSSTTKKIYGIVDEAYANDSSDKWGAMVLIDGNAAVEKNAKEKLTVVTAGAAAYNNVLVEVKYNTSGVLLKQSGETAAAHISGNTTASAVIENGNLKFKDAAGDVTDSGALAQNVHVYVYDYTEKEWTIGDTSDLDINFEVGTDANFYVAYYCLDSDDTELITDVVVCHDL